MRFLPIAGLCAALAGSMGVSPSCAQEENFTRSTYPVANARPDGSRDLNPLAKAFGNRNLEHAIRAHRTAEG